MRPVPKLQLGNALPAKLRFATLAKRSDRRSTTGVWKRHGEVGIPTWHEWTVQQFL
jgi:hypothetical protein